MAPRLARISQVAAELLIEQAWMSASSFTPAATANGSRSLILFPRLPACQQPNAACPRNVAWVRAHSRYQVSRVPLAMSIAPNTLWLDGCVTLDTKGFIKTGPTLSPEDLSAAHWPIARPPYLLETSLPGVFAVGDVRGGSTKRVAAAVGEGSIAISFVHQVLQE